MDMQEVTSSQLSSIGYDPARSVLAVRFKNGGLYEYAGVSPETYQEFVAAESKGSFLFKQIKGKYEYTRMPEEKQAT